MKKSMQLLGLVAVAAIGVLSFNPTVKARVTGVLYGDSLVIGYPGTTVAAIDEDGAVTATKITNSGQMAFQSVSSTTLRTLVPVAAGAVVYGSTYQSLCVSTGTGAGAWVFVSTNGFAGSAVPCDQ